MSKHCNSKASAKRERQRARAAQRAMVASVVRIEADKRFFDTWRPSEAYFEAPLQLRQTKIRLVKFWRTGEIIWHRSQEWEEPVTPYAPNAEPIEEPMEIDGIRVPAVWSERLVLEWLKEAMQTTRMMHVKNLWPAGYQSNMPEPIREAVEAYGWGEVAVRRQPTLEEISRMDHCMPEWLAMVDDHRHRRALIGAAMGLDLRVIGRFCGCSHTTARTWYKLAIACVTERLNQRQAHATPAAACN